MAAHLETRLRIFHGIPRYPQFRSRGPVQIQRMYMGMFVTLELKHPVIAALLQ